MLKPVRVSSAAAIAKWNQSMPKYHRYNGTAVRVRTKVPIRNELVIQLIRSVGIRKIKGVSLVESDVAIRSQACAGPQLDPETNGFSFPRSSLITPHFRRVGGRELRPLLSRYGRRRNAHS